MKRRRTTRAMTLTDVVIGLVLVGLFVAMTARTARSLGSAADRAACAANLGRLAAAVNAYASAAKGEFPRTRYDAPSPATSCYTRPEAADPFADDGPDYNDTSAAIFLLVRQGHVSPEDLICPATDLVPWDLGGRPASAVSNFPSGRHLGYSIAHPYPDGAAVRAGYRLNLGAAHFVVAADMNPGVPALLRPPVPGTPAVGGNSFNHGGEGQNVAFADQHVEFWATPAERRWDDNIYVADVRTGGGSGTTIAVGSSPQAADDTVLLPVATVHPKADGFASLYWPASIAVGLAALALIAVSVRRAGQVRRYPPGPVKPPPLPPG